MICLSILLLYLRLFPKTWLHKGSYVAAGLTVIWFIAQVIVFICQCTPVQSFWNMKIIGHCIDENKFYAAGCSISMINIIAVFFLPLPIIWKLQISRSKKWSLMLAFCIGVVYVFLNPVLSEELIPTSQQILRQQYSSSHFGAGN